MSNMCSDVTEHFHRNHLNNLSLKPFKGTLKCCGGNYTNTVRTAILCIKRNNDSGLTLNTIIYFNYFLH